MICHDCHMNVPDNADGTASYHPHLHCTLWREYRTDPTKLLADHGYQRTAPDPREQQ